MTVSISASGLPAAVKEQVTKQVKSARAELEKAGNTHGVGIAESMRQAIGAKLAGVPEDASVSVSASCYISVSVAQAQPKAEAEKSEKSEK